MEVGLIHPALCSNEPQMRKLIAQFGRSRFGRSSCYCTIGSRPWMAQGGALKKQGDMTMRLANAALLFMLAPVTAGPRSMSNRSPKPACPSP